MASLAVLLLLTGACATAGAQDRIIVLEADLPASAGLADGTWQSAAFSGDPWIPYGADTEVELFHGLGRSPRSVLVYVSFDASGTSPSLATGDLATLGALNDSSVVFRNRTGAELFARVVLQ